MDSNLEIIKSIYENECQRIVECKDIKTGEIFIYNTIFNQKLIKLIDVNILNSIKSNIVKCQKTQDRLYIVTKPHNLNNQKILKEYIDSGNLTLKQQFSMTQQLINLFIQIYNVTDLLQFKILSFDNLSVSYDDVLFVNGYFEFKDEYDLSDNYSYKSLGNIIHYLFSKEDIVDYNISDTIPPDVLKIIVKCLTKEYFHPKDILKEFENSPIYGIINCKTDSPVNCMKLSDLAESKIDEKTEGSQNSQNDESLYGEQGDGSNNTDDLGIKLDVDEGYNEFNDENNTLLESEEAANDKDDDLNIIDIYLNNAANDKNNRIDEHEDDSKLKKAMKFIIPIFIILFVTIVSIFLIKGLYGKGEKTSGSNVNQVENNDKDKDDDKNSDKDNDNDKDNDSSKDNDKSDLDLDSSEFKLYLNNDLIRKTGYTGKTAVLDNEVYNEGTSSLLAENDTDETAKILFAVIDFTNDKLSYMKNNQVGIAAKFKGLKDVDAKLVVEAYIDGKMVANSNGKIQIFDDIWIQKQITVDVGNIDRVDLYIEYSGKNKIWIDMIDIDVSK